MTRAGLEPRVLESGALAAGPAGFTSGDMLLCEMPSERAGWTLHAGAANARFTYDAGRGVRLAALRTGDVEVPIAPGDLWRVTLRETGTGRLVEIGPAATNLRPLAPPTHRNHEVIWHLRWEGLRPGGGTTIDVVQTWQVLRDHPRRFRVTLRVLFGAGESRFALIAISPLRVAPIPEPAPDERYFLALGDGIVVTNPRRATRHAAQVTAGAPAGEPDPDPTSGAAHGEALNDTFHYPGDLSMMLRGFGSFANGYLVLVHGEGQGRAQLVRDRADRESLLFESFESYESNDRMDCEANDHTPLVSARQWIAVSRPQGPFLTQEIVRDLRAWSNRRRAARGETLLPWAERPEIDEELREACVWWWPDHTPALLSLPWLAGRAAEMRTILGLRADAPIPLTLEAPPPTRGKATPPTGPAQVELVESLRQDHAVHAGRVLDRPAARRSPGLYDPLETRAPQGWITAEPPCDTRIGTAQVFALCAQQGPRPDPATGRQVRPVALFAEICRGLTRIVCRLPSDPLAQDAGSRGERRTALAQAFLAGEILGLNSPPYGQDRDFLRTLVEATDRWRSLILDGSPLPSPLIHEIRPEPPCEASPVRRLAGAAGGPDRPRGIGLIAVNALIAGPLQIDLELELGACDGILEEGREHQRRLVEGCAGRWTEARLPPVSRSLRHILAVPPGGVALLEIEGTVAHRGSTRTP